MMSLITRLKNLFSSNQTNSSQQKASSHTPQTAPFPQLSDIKLDLNGARPIKSHDNSAVWCDEQGDFIGLDIYRGQPDLPALHQGEDQLRPYFRESCRACQSDLVECDVVTEDEMTGVRCVNKAPMEVRGFQFQGSWLIPWRDFFIVIRVQCLEHSPTGAREAAVMILEQPTLELEPEPHAPQERSNDPLYEGAISLGQLKGWRKDAYDPAFDEGALRNLSDDRKYDASFPDHPLSRARRKIDQLIATTKFSPELRQSPPFAVPAGQATGSTAPS